MITEPFRVYPKINELADGYFDTLGRAASEGRTILWGPALIPYELFRAVDMAYVLGEPYGLFSTPNWVANSPPPGET